MFIVAKWTGLSSLNIFLLTRGIFIVYCNDATLRECFFIPALFEESLRLPADRLSHLCSWISLQSFFIEKNRSFDDVVPDDEFYDRRGSAAEVLFIWRYSILRKFHRALSHTHRWIPLSNSQVYVCRCCSVRKTFPLYQWPPDLHVAYNTYFAMESVY